jgi:hypothetical protein
MPFVSSEWIIIAAIIAKINEKTLLGFGCCPGDFCTRFAKIRYNQRKISHFMESVLP